MKSQFHWKRFLNSIYIPIVILIVFIFASFEIHAQDLPDAIKQYKDGKFQESLQNFSQLEASGSKGRDLYYNIGNCLYQLKRYPEAILYFEKALRWEPSCRPCKQNLLICKKAAGIEDLELNSFFIITYFNQLSQILTSMQWLILCALGLICSVYLYFKRKLKTYSVISILFISLLLLALSLWSNALRFTDNETILMVDSGLHISPDKMSEVKIQLKAGTKLKSVDHLGKWLKVQNSELDLGWIESSELRKIEL